MAITQLWLYFPDLWGVEDAMSLRYLLLTLTLTAAGSEDPESSSMLVASEHVHISLIERCLIGRTCRSQYSVQSPAVYARSMR